MMKEQTPPQLPAIEKPTERTSQPLRQFPLALALPAGARDNLEVGISQGVYYLKTWLAMNRHPSIKRAETVSFAMPKNWWQHLKDQCLPSWLKRWFPVKMTVLEREIKWEEGPVLVCPHIRKTDVEDHIGFLKGGTDGQ